MKNIDAILDKLEKHPAVKARMVELKAEQEQAKKKKEAIVGVRMAKQEKAKLQEEAEQDSKTLSEFIRSLVIRK